MIHIKDLRIGNLIVDNLNKSRIEITGVNCFTDLITCYTRNEGVVDRYDIRAIECSGIPLTEGWLVKLGLSNQGYREGYYGLSVKSGNLIYDFVLWVNNNEISYELKGSLIVIINSVHQLQNLFYYLSDKELTLKEGK